jgi:predicted  nucleic acid-binding Zn-ribbon protein
MNLYALFPEPRCDAARRLAELGARHGELTAELRTLEAEHDSATADVADAQAALHGAEARQHALGDAGDAVKAARRRLTAAEKSAPGREERLRLTRDALAAIDGETRSVAVQHAAELLDELGEDATAAHQALTEALGAVTAGREAWRTEHARLTRLLAVVEPDALVRRAVPDLPREVDDAAKQAAGLAASVPVPVVDRRLEAPIRERIDPTPADWQPEAVDPAGKWEGRVYPHG